MKLTKLAQNWSQPFIISMLYYRLSRLFMVRSPWISSLWGLMRLNEVLTVKISLNRSVYTWFLVHLLSLLITQVHLGCPPTGSTTPINLSTGLKVNYKNTKNPKERNPKIWMPKKDFFKVLHIKSRVFQRIMSQSATGFNYFFNFSICITLTLTF